MNTYYIKRRKRKMFLDWMEKVTLDGEDKE